MTLLAAAPALAQAINPEEGRYRERGPILYVDGGGFSALRDVTEQGLDFKTGYNLGGGIGYQMSRYLAIRANLSFSRADLQGPSGVVTPGGSIDPLALEGRRFNKYFYGGDLQIRYPSRVGLAPYAVLGGGAVTVDMPSGSVLSNFTKPAGKVGAGIGYTLPNSGASIFGEWDGWVYKWDNNSLLDPTTTNVDRTQFDSTWSAGVRYVF